MAKYAANLVTIPESILYEFPSIRLEVWYFHYFRNLIIFQTKHGAETFVDFHRKRIQHYRNSRHQSRQQSARAEYEVSVALLEYPIRCVDDPNFFRQGSRGIRLGSRRFTASFTFGNPDIRHTKGFQDLNAKHGNIQHKIEEIEGAIDENKISNLQEEMRDLDSELSELQSEITGMEEERENQVADTRELELKLKNLGLRLENERLMQTRATTGPKGGERVAHVFLDATSRKSKSFSFSLYGRIWYRPSLSFLNRGPKGFPLVSTSDSGAFPPVLGAPRSLAACLKPFPAIKTPISSKLDTRKTRHTAPRSHGHNFMSRPTRVWLTRRRQSGYLDAIAMC